MLFQSKVNPGKIKLFAWPNFHYFTWISPVSFQRDTSLVQLFSSSFLAIITDINLALLYRWPLLIFNFSPPGDLCIPWFYAICFRFTLWLSSNWCMKWFCVQKVCWKPMGSPTITPPRLVSLSIDELELHMNQHCPGYILLYKYNVSETLNFIQKKIVHMSLWMKIHNIFTVFSLFPFC